AYDLFIADPGDSRITNISEKFIKESPVDADIAFSLLKRLTKEFDQEIISIPEDEDYFSRHIFRTGFIEYPGIGYEIERLLREA
ncbi:MAG: hypothetical protein AABX59_02695, partial [Nanoarchaeota archaeon]